MTKECNFCEELRDGWRGRF